MNVRWILWTDIWDLSNSAFNLEYYKTYVQFWTVTEKIKK
jgi:hypothetical protein